MYDVWYNLKKRPYGPKLIEELGKCIFSSLFVHWNGMKRYNGEN